MAPCVQQQSGHWPYCHLPLLTKIPPHQNLQLPSKQMLGHLIAPWLKHVLEDVTPLSMKHVMQWQFALDMGERVVVASAYPMYTRCMQL